MATVPKRCWARPLIRFPMPIFVGITREELARHLIQHGEASIESLRLTKDGRQVWIESRAMMIRGSADAPGGSIWVDRDITARKEAEEALQRMEEELTLGAQERAALNERQRLARELHDSVSQALYGISLGAHTALTVLDTDREKAREAAELHPLAGQHRADGDARLDLRAATRSAGDRRSGGGAQQELGRAARSPRHRDRAGTTRRTGPSIGSERGALSHRPGSHAKRGQACALRPAGRAPGLRAGWLLPRSVRQRIGFDPHAAYPGHLGLRSMRERAATWAARWIFSSLPDSGTQIRAFVPGPARTSSECW